MTHFLTIVAEAPTLQDEDLARIEGAKVREAHWLRKGKAVSLPIDTQAASRAKLQPVMDALQADFNLSAMRPQPAKLFLADMDSTMITVECIDELADYAGLKADVSAVTDAAMRGELDFNEALTERVALLAGLSEATLEECYRERVTFSPGAKSAVATMSANACRCVLVSGGFTFFTHKVAEALGFHKHKANVLEIKDGELTGAVVPPISNAQTKVDTLRQEAAELNLQAAQILSVGDGANDIAMLQAAGVGVAYKAKPKTKDAASCAIEYSDLETLLYFQGLTPEE